MCPRLVITSSTVQKEMDRPLVSGTVYWLHFYACDDVGNCGMSYSDPIMIDATPPVRPLYVTADVRALISSGPCPSPAIDCAHC